MKATQIIRQLQQRRNRTSLNHVYAQLSLYTHIKHVSKYKICTSVGELEIVKKLKNNGEKKALSSMHLVKSKS